LRSAAVLRQGMHEGLRQDALGLRRLGSHSPLLPDATRRAIAVCNEEMTYVVLHCDTTALLNTLDGLRKVPDLIRTGRSAYSAV
jgi:hypothetical protein